MRWLLIQLSLLFIYATATEICSECRPLELQRAPGLGIDLAIGYGTAAIQHRNGTIVDVIKVPGTQAYIQAMKVLAEDAIRVRAGEESQLPLIQSAPLIATTSLFKNLSPSRIYQYLKQIITQPDTPNDPWVLAVAGMLAEIKSTVSVKYGLAYPFIILSVPDFEADTRHIYKQRFEVAAQHAGLELFMTVTIASRSALGFYGIRDCYEGEPDSSCSPPEERIDVILSVSYSEVSLGVTLLTRWMGGELWGTFWPQRLSENLKLGRGSLARQKAPEKYWDDVKSVIDNSVEAVESVDRVIFLGFEGSDDEEEELRRVVRVIMEKHKSEKGLGLVESDTNNDSGESLFAVARGAAMVARRGMVDGFDACIMPDHCERDEEKDEKGKAGANEQVIKSEL